MNKRSLRHYSGLAVFLAVLLSCAGPSRFVENPSTFSEDLMIRGETADLSFTLEHIILPEGPGAWVRGAKWDEYLVTLQNKSGRTLAITDIWLVDVRGFYLESRLDPVRLESESEALQRKYAGVGLATAAGVASAAAAAGVLGGAAATGALATVGPAAIIAAPLIPFWEFRQRLRTEAEKESIQREFNRRKLISWKYAPDVAATRGSLFFPIAPDPRALEIEYTAGGRAAALRLPLDKLKGMHEELRKRLEAERKEKEEPPAMPEPDEPEMN